jgi:hypothetical protein
MAKKSEGAEVRAAFVGPQVEHDEFMDFVGARNAEDSKRASSAAESRQKIGEFLDETNLNGKAVSIARQILKIKDEDKQADLIRSLDAVLPMVKLHVSGQSTPDMFPGVTTTAVKEKPVAAEVSDADLANFGPATTTLSAQTYTENFDVSDGDADLEGDAELDDFDKHLAKLAG